MCHAHMRFGPEYKDLCHHAEQLLSLRVWLFQPAGSATNTPKHMKSITDRTSVKLKDNHYMSCAIPFVYSKYFLILFL